MNRLLVLLTVCLALLAGACRQSAGGVLPENKAAGDVFDLQLKLMADPAEPVIGLVSWRVTLVDTGGAPIKGAVVAVRGDMTHAGMVPVEAKAVEQEGGVYLADFEWTMAGDWIVTVTAELPDGREIVEKFPFTVTLK